MNRSLCLAWSAVLVVASANSTVGQAAAAIDPVALQKAVAAIEALDADSLPSLLRSNEGLAAGKLPDGRSLMHVLASQPCAAGSRQESSVLTMLGQLSTGGADAAASDTKGLTPLHYAAKTGNPNIVRSLGVTLDAAAINAADKGGVTPLLSACTAGNLEAVKVLIELGANPKVRTIDGGSALHAAAATRPPSMATVARVFDRLTIRDGNGEPPAGTIDWLKVIAESTDAKGQPIQISPAELQAREDLLRLLIDKGVDVDAKNKNGATAMHVAASAPVPALCQQLVLRGSKAIDLADGNGTTPLLNAALTCQTATAEYLIAQGAAVDAANEGGWTPLMAAGVVGDEKTLKLLLDKGAKIGATDVSGQTPMHFAALGGKLPALELLLKAGLDVDTPSKIGVTPLRLAAAQGHLEAVKWFIAHKASLTSLSKDQLTPLHAACVTGTPEVCEALLAAGAELTAKDSRGYFPQHVAAEAGNTAVLALLESKGLDVNGVAASGVVALHLAAETGRAETVKWLLAHKADPNVVGGGRQITPLHSGAYGGSVEVVQALLAAGAKVNVKSGDGSTPLMVATLQKRKALYALLIAAGADPSITNDTGKSPLSTALNAGDWDTLKILTPKK